MHKYKVDLDVLDYQIILDENKKIKSIQSRNEQFKSIRGVSNFNTHKLKIALRIMFLYEQEKFEELFLILKENDPEMFSYAEIAVNENAWINNNGSL